MFAAGGIRIYFTFRIVAAFDMCGGPFFQGDGAFHEVLVVDGAGHFFRGAAAGPLEEVRIAVHVSHVAEFPYAGVLFVDGAFYFLQQEVEPAGGVLPFGENKTVVRIEREHGNQYLSVYIILDMFVCLVADAHRLVAQVAIQVREDGFHQVLFAGNAIEGLVAEIAREGDVRNIPEVALHFLKVTDVIERGYNIIGIAHPAVAVIPVAAGVHILRQAGGAGGDDGAGILILVNFQGEGGADDIRLEVVGDGGLFNPAAPVEGRFPDEALGRAFQRRFQRVAVGKEQVAGIVQDEQLFVYNIIDCDIGSEADAFFAAYEFDMAAAAEGGQFPGAVIANGPALHFNTGRAFDGFHLADQHEGLEEAFVLDEAGRHVGNAVAAFGGGDFRAEDIGILHIILVRGIMPLGQYGKFAALLFVQQAAEQESTVHTRPAEPVNVGVEIYMCDISAVSDNASLVGMSFHMIRLDMKALIKYISLAKIVLFANDVPQNEVRADFCNILGTQFR